MIRDYLTGDIDKLHANQYSMVGAYKDVILNPQVQKLTLEIADEVKAIIGMFEYHPNNWSGFFLISEEMTLESIKELRKTLELLIKIKQPKRLETTSEDCKAINKWMEFMGFECEGIKKNYMFDKDYRMWSRLWS